MTFRQRAMTAADRHGSVVVCEISHGSIRVVVVRALLLRGEISSPINKLRAAVRLSSGP